MTRTPDKASVALPVLGAGTVGGLVGSLFCFCWLASLPAGYIAVRSAAKAQGGRMSSGRAVGVGLGTGLVLGLLTASLGTAIFVASLDPAAMEEAAAMSSSLMGDGPEMSAGLAAAGHAMLAFVVNVFLGVLGAALGATSLPPVPVDEAPVDAATEPDWRFEPPPGWTPDGAGSRGAVEAPEVDAGGDESGPQGDAVDARAADASAAEDGDSDLDEDDDSASDGDTDEQPPVQDSVADVPGPEDDEDPGDEDSDLGEGLDEDPATDPGGAPLTPESAHLAHSEIPAEAFVSAWRSKAVGGTPVPAPKQAPPEDSTSPSGEQPTQGVPSARDEGDTLS